MGIVIIFLIVVVIAITIWRKIEINNIVRGIFISATPEEADENEREVYKLHLDLYFKDLDWQTTYKLQNDEEVYKIWNKTMGLMSDPEMIVWSIRLFKSHGYEVKSLTLKQANKLYDEVWGETGILIRKTRRDL